MDDKLESESLTGLVDLIRNAERILIFTGAGISTPSGIPDFRGPQGVWKRRQPVYFQDFQTSETSRLEYWDQKLESYWAFRDAEPNTVHEACVTLEQVGKVVAVITQNVDACGNVQGMSG